MSVVLRLAAPCALAVSATLGACGGDGGGSTEAFCDDVRTNAEAMMNPQLANQQAVTDHVELYERIGADVPLAIEEDWDVLVGMIRTTASVVPGDEASAETARRAVFAAEESSMAVLTWINANCDLDLASVGPVATYNPAATTTTVAGVAGTVAPPVSG